MQSPYFLCRGFPLPRKASVCRTIRKHNNYCVFTPPWLSTNQMHSTWYFLNWEKYNMSIQCVCFPSLTRLTQVCIHNKSSNKLSAAIYFTSVWYKQFSDLNKKWLFMHSWLWKMCFINLPTGSEKSIIYQLVQLLSLRSPKNCFRILVWVNQMQSGHVVVSPLIFTLVLCPFSSIECSNTTWTANFKILLYSFQLLPTTVMFQKFPITFWFTDKMSFFCR